MKKIIQGYRQVGRDQTFRRFWIGMMISRAGDAFTAVALSWLVLGIAGPLQLGVVLMCFGLPRIVGGPVAGWLLERFEPRLLLTADNAARGLLIAVVPGLVWLHALAVADLYGIAVASALLSAVTEVAEGALLPRLIADDDLEAANSLLSLNWELAYIVGPAVAGAVVATIGGAYALLADAASFAVMAAICSSLPAMRADTPASAADVGTTARPGITRNWLGLGILFQFPAVLILSVCSLVVLFLGGMAEVLYPVYSRTFLHAGATGYGVLVSATGVGALLGVVLGVGLLRRLSPAARIGVVLLSGVPLFGLLSSVRGLPEACLLVGLASFAWGPYYALERSLSQRLTPDHVRPRVVGARMALSSLGFPLGSALGGLLLKSVSTPAVVLTMAGAYVLLGLTVLLASPLRRLDAGRRPGQAESGSQAGRQQQPATAD